MCFLSGCVEIIIKVHAEVCLRKLNTYEMIIISLSLSLPPSLQDQGADPCTVKAKMIADRLKIIGDEVEDEHLRSRLEEITIALGDAVLNNSTLQTILLMYTQNNLSWRKVAELFKLLCKVMETRTRYDDQFSLFEKAWYCLLDSVVPWIQDRGGWVSPYTNY